ncbi:MULTISPECIES: DUF1146 family protein [Lactobacillaceae]|uniref:DUF1146 family protein n=1 Tax=Lactobacillaceae TaxID=33958 RepID=UPI000C1B65D6|nr:MULTISPECIES: DUF1146 family protein [Lactobacillaceae]
MSLSLISLVTLISHLVFITITYNILQSIDWNKIFRSSNDPRPLRFFVLFLSIAIGYNVSTFFISIFTLSQSFSLLFR